METGMQIFERSEFGSVRVVEHNGEPWFVARDVAKALGYQNTVEAVNTHCKKANDFRDSKMLPSATPMKIIPESDVYRLVMRSNLPGAVEFQDWVVEDVLPSIRKTGSYSIAQRNGGEQMPGVTLSEKIYSARAILDDIGVKGNQRALALDNVYKKATGESALETMEIELPSERQEQLLTPTQLGQLMGGLSAKKVNQLLIDEGYQRRLPGGALEPTAKGLDAGAVLMDTGKRHSSGVPVCQLKWRSSVAGKIASAA